MNSKTGTGLDRIPDHENILIDANICLYAIRRGSSQCERFLERCAKEEISGILPTHILAEIMHQLMIAEARDNQWIKGPNPARQLALAPQRVRSLRKYEEVVRDIIGIGVLIEPVVQEDILSAMSIQRQSGLLTNDALLVAVGERLRVTNIASADKAFSRVEGISVFSPEDIKL
jgi:predicted nucleic acid-binding protein